MKKITVKWLKQNIGGSFDGTIYRYMRVIESDFIGIKVGNIISETELLNLGTEKYSIIIIP